MIDKESGQKTLANAAKTVWRINNALWSLAIWLAPVYVAFLFIFDDEVSIWILLLTAIAATFLTVLLVFLMPEIRWKRWKYRVDEHEIDLEHGIFIIRRTLIPVKRVQHVDTRQGPILRSYNLADVVISTAATTHKIPALTESTADQVRSEISTFARKAKDDV